MATIYTIGHSNKSIESFVSLLQHYNIDTLADIRSHPGSRYCPWFNSENMSVYLREHGIGYVHIPKLGGKRSTQWKVDTRINSGWTNYSFHSYADYSLTLQYEQGLSQLLNIASNRRVCYMCAEAVPWKCHRLLVSNTLAARGHEILHIMSKTKLEKHKLGIWGAPVHVDECMCCTYPSDKPVQLMLSL